MPTKTPPTGSRKIMISKDGPYIVSGGIPLTMEIIEPNAEGLSWNWKTAKSFKTSGGCKKCRWWQAKKKTIFCGPPPKQRFVCRRGGDPPPYTRQGEAVCGP